MLDLDDAGKVTAMRGFKTGFPHRDLPNGKRAERPDKAAVLDRDEDRRAVQEKLVLARRAALDVYVGERIADVHANDGVDVLDHVASSKGFQLRRRAAAQPQILGRQPAREPVDRSTGCVYS